MDHSSQFIITCKTIKSDYAARPTFLNLNLNLNSLRLQQTSSKRRFSHRNILLIFWVFVSLFFQLVESFF